MPTPLMNRSGPDQRGARVVKISRVSVVMVTSAVTMCVCRCPRARQLHALRRAQEFEPVLGRVVHRGGGLPDPVHPARRSGAPGAASSVRCRPSSSNCCMRSPSRTWVITPSASVMRRMKPKMSISARIQCRRRRREPRSAALQNQGHRAFRPARSTPMARERGGRVAGCARFIGQVRGRHGRCASSLPWAASNVSQTSRTAPVTAASGYTSRHARAPAGGRPRPRCRARPGASQADRGCRRRRTRCVRARSRLPPATRPCAPCFIAASLQQVPDAQVTHAVCDHLGVAAGQHCDLQPAVLGHADAMAVAAVEGLVLLAAVTEEQAAVGQDAVDVQDQQADLPLPRQQFFGCISAIRQPPRAAGRAC
jgi:hypothetical protein